MIAALLLSACGSKQNVPDATTLSGIYTSVAITLAAQSISFESTATLMEVSTPLPTATALPTSMLLPTATSYVSSASSYANGCDNSAYVSDVTISDGTVLAPGETFTKTWKFENDGSCTWSEAYSITFVSGSRMDGSDTDIDRSVDPGEKAEVSVSLTAPDTEGTYTGYWRLANASGSAFGQMVYVQIVVSDSASTSTSTSTPTSTSTTQAGTSTPTTVPATSTPTETFTPVPTSTPEVSPTDASGG